MVPRGAEVATNEVYMSNHLSTCADTRRSLPPYKDIANACKPPTLTTSDVALKERIKCRAALMSDKFIDCNEATVTLEVSPAGAACFNTASMMQLISMIGDDLWTKEARMVLETVLPSFLQ